MFLSKCILALSVLFIGVNCRYVYKENYFQPIKHIAEEANLEDSYEDALVAAPRYVLLAILPENGDLNHENVNMNANEGSPSFEEFEDQPRRRVARQASGKVDVHIPDQKIDLTGSIPLVKGDKNGLGAFGKIEGLKPGHVDSVGAGLVLENANGHRLVAMGSHSPDLGNRLTAAGTVNLMNTPDHKLDTTAFVSKTLTSIPNVPDFTTYGGNMDYTFKNKIGATLGAQQTPAFGQTSLSAMGNLNLYKTPSSSLDFSSGISRTYTPFKSFNEPRFDFTWSRSW